MLLRRRSCSRCGHVPRCADDGSARVHRGASRRSCRTRCASSSRERSRRSICRRRRSARGWRCSLATRAVIEDDGSTMTVRSALARINEILDQVLNEQEGDFDTHTRFAIAWFRQHGYVEGRLRRRRQHRPRAQHVGRHDGPRRDPHQRAPARSSCSQPTNCRRTTTSLTDDRVSIWEVLHHLIARLERGGLPDAGDFLRGSRGAARRRGRRRAREGAGVPAVPDRGEATAGPRTRCASTPWRPRGPTSSTRLASGAASGRHAGQLRPDEEG